AVFISFIKLRWKQQEDILVAAFWSVGMAIGILFISKTPGYSVDLMSFLFGNILLVSESDLILMMMLDIITVGIVFLFYKQFMAAVFDEEFARLRGIRIEIYYTILMCMIALTVVLLIQIVGLILVIALLIFPAACAAQFFHSLFKMMLAATVICLLMTVSGLVIAYQPDLPAGATIIVVAGVFYAIAIASSSVLKQQRKKTVTS
ncbi:MAG: metal ABC transporter permease, partial [Proteobacteria bacterium]|nr:metal ABC transporter permease [Pseudomonadota bacterium]